MKKIMIVTLLFMLVSCGLSNTENLVSQLNSYEEQLLALEHADAPGNTAKIVRLQNEIFKTKQQLNEDQYVSPAKIYSSAPTLLSNDFTLVSLVLYDWSKSYYRLIAHIRNDSFVYAEWVKLFFYFYKNGNPVGDDFSYIDYQSYGNNGVLPYHESFLMTYVSKSNFDSIGVEIRYDERDGTDAILCDQILQLMDVSITPTGASSPWNGKVNNSSTWSVEYPKVFANIMRSDSLIGADYAFLDTECQGERTAIIDYVVDTPPEAQEIVLRNCSDENINLGGWYLGHKISPHSYTIPAGTILKADDHLSFNNDDLNFTIGTQDEIIYLSNAEKTLIDQWTKEESETILNPLTTACFNSFLDLPDTYKKIKHRFNYSLSSLKGTGNLPPNMPVFTAPEYHFEPNTTYTLGLFLLDPDEDRLDIQVDWDNGERTGWLGSYSSRSVTPVSYSFSQEGDHWVSARTRDSHGLVSNWSDSVRVFVSRWVPVELAFFNARVVGNKVILNWRTESETNNLGFSIERSSNKQAWEQIGFVAGHGTTVEARAYSFEDHPETSCSYRLKQIDQDGAAHYTEIISIELETPHGFDIASIYPNPFNASTRIEYQLAAKSKIQIDVFGVNGQHIKTLQHEEKEAGHHFIMWQAASAPSGAYIVRLQSGGQTTFQKCIVLK